jgi:hypothetical protein
MRPRLQQNDSDTASIDSGVSVTKVIQTRPTDTIHRERPTSSLQIRKQQQQHHDINAAYKHARVPRSRSTPEPVNGKPRELLHDRAY